MNVILKIINQCVAVIFVVMQQVFILLFGFVAYAQGYFITSIIIWFACIPMLWINKWTFKYVCKYGFINFWAMLVDTCEIDIPKGKRWYDR